MNNLIGGIKTRVLTVLFSLGIFSGFITVNTQASNGRVFKLKAQVVSKNIMVRMEDIVENNNVLTPTEKLYTLMDTPTNKDRYIKTIDIAYMMQAYSSLMDAKLRGPEKIVVKKMTDTRYLDKAKSLVLNHLNKNSPWSSWEIDLLFTSSDELLVSRIGSFDTMTVRALEGKNMLGNVSFRLIFKDEYERPVGKVVINPVILKKIEVAVAESTVKKGDILRAEQIKTVPLWVGNEKKDYIRGVKDCIGREIAKTITAGELIRGSFLLNPVCAKRGELIWVDSINGGLTVRAAVLAMEKGRKNDYIKVRNQSSQKMFTVKLVGIKKAEQNI